MTIIGSKILAINGWAEGSQWVEIQTSAGTLIIHHDQQCCEHCSIEETEGTPEDLIGQIVTGFKIKQNTKSEDVEYTFYELSTNSDDLMMRWCGDRSVGTGYYSIEVESQWYPNTRPIRKGDVLEHITNGDYIEAITYSSQYSIKERKWVYGWNCKTYTNDTIYLLSMPEDSGLYNGEWKLL